MFVMRSLKKHITHSALKFRIKYY